MMIRSQCSRTPDRIKTHHCRRHDFVSSSATTRPHNIKYNVSRGEGMPAWMCRWAEHYDRQDAIENQYFGRDHSLKIQYHWVFSVFTDNIHSLCLCQLAGAFNQICNSIESAGVLELECLLKPPSVGHYAIVVRRSEGSFLYLQMCPWVGQDVWKSIQRHLGQVQKPIVSILKEVSFPQAKSSRAGRMGWCVQSLVNVCWWGFDPNGNNECFTRSEDGVFVWSDVASKKLREANIAGATDIKSKQMTMVCCMFEFLYLYYLGFFAPFKPFIIGQSINLQLQQRWIYLYICFV